MHVVIKFANTTTQQTILDREVALLGVCRHRHIAKVLDTRRDDAGRATALVMAYAGPTWADHFGARPADIGTLLPMAGQVARALDAMHKVSALHLDIKPANLAVDDQGNACILDFGVAARGQHGQPSANGATMFVTRNAGMTDRYAAPEHRDPHRGMDKFADQYSLAVTLLDLIEGTVVSQARLPVERGSARLPPAGNNAMTKALSLSPSGRYASCVAFVAALRRGCGL